MKPRPTLLIAEPEPLEALSTRKLVMETAKFNVLTAHSTDEAVTLFQMFPNISAAVLVDSDAIRSEQVTKFIKTVITTTPVIALSPRQGYRSEGADYHLSSHEPEQLVELLRSILGDPRNMDEVSGAVRSEADTTRRS